ncbi:hypothetical protein TNCV_618331 [Trichonephila clavipes]|nr:hypothetical protein TNCV_618331 [Trichonephila clavipes]
MGPGRPISLYVGFHLLFRPNNPSRPICKAGMKMDGDCKAKLADGTVVEFEAGASLFTDPISNVGKCI